MTDHRAEADHRTMADTYEEQDGFDATEHLLAAIHDLLAERLSDSSHRAAMRTLAEEQLTATREAVDLLREVRASIAPKPDTAADPRCDSIHPTGLRRCTRPVGHGGMHGYAGLFWPEPEREPEPETVTVTLPREALETDVRRHAQLLRRPGHAHNLTANVLDALADALEADR